MGEIARTGEDARQEDRQRTDEDAAPATEQPEDGSTRFNGARPPGAPDLSPEERKRRAALVEQARQVRKAIDEALANIPPEEIERMEREWIEEVDEAIRQRAIRLIRQAS